MICPIENCGGRYMAKGSRMSKRTGFWTRKRICDKCGHTDTTIEVSKEQFGMEMDLLEAFQVAIEKYNFKKDELDKPSDVDKDVA